MKIYAKQLDPEFFDYRVYEDMVSEEIIVERNRDFPGMHDDDLEAIKKMFNDYDGYEFDVYYEHSIKMFVNDYLPKKYNGKRYSPVELHKIREALKKADNVDVVLLCLELINGKPYEERDIRGYCQGDWCRVYCPVDTTTDEIDYLEAVYFGTGTEYEIHDGDNEPQNEDEIEGYSYLSTKWRDEDVKQEIADQFAHLHIKPEDVVLYKIERTYQVKHIEYKQV